MVVVLETTTTTMKKKRRRKKKILVFLATFETLPSLSTVPRFVDLVVLPIAYVL